MKLWNMKERINYGWEKGDVKTGTLCCTAMHLTDAGYEDLDLAQLLPDGIPEQAFVNTVMKLLSKLNCDS
jgi:hypothetical protein